MQSPDWDALAPYWEHFEGGGLNWRMLADIAPLLRPPLLYVGSGRGGLAARLGRTVALSVDRSPAMCARALREHGVACVAADAARLPLRSGSFSTVLCATGVLEYLDRSGRARVLAELGRVGGQVLVFAASGDSGVHWEINQHALVQAWFNGRPVAAFDAVAAAMGDRAAARTLLLASLPQRGHSVSGADLAAAAADAEMTVVAGHVDDDGIARWHLWAERVSRR